MSEMTTSLSNALEVFDTSYKDSEDKDSDEESFHLPLEDEEMDSKTNTTEKLSETEEDILNKFAAVDEEDGIGEKIENKELTSIDAPESQESLVKDATSEITEDENDVDINKISEKLDEDKPESVENIVGSCNSEGEALEINNTESDIKSNEESCDLLNISIIRDADQDNAESEINEVLGNVEDVDDNKTETETETETNIEYEDVINEENIKSPSSETGVQTDEQNSEDASNSMDTTEDITEVSSNLEKIETNEVQTNVSQYDEVEVESIKNSENNSECEINNESSEENVEKRKSLKRATSDEIESEPKKARLEADKMPTNNDNSNNNNNNNNLDNTVDIGTPDSLRPLLVLADFMKSKKSNGINKRRLTVKDMEEFCLQKISEVLTNRCKIGEVDSMLKQEDHLVETMRKEIVNLTKQVRDLEIVNRKLMSDLKNQASSLKPLTPLKITRSVGLQVKFTPVPETKRRSLPPSAPSTPAPTKIVTPKNIRASLKLTTPTTQPQNQTPIQAAPILSQVLQQPVSPAFQTVAKQVQVALPPPTTPRGGNVPLSTPSKAPLSSIIDLTDEDDKKFTSTPTTTGTLIPIKINSVNGKNLRITTSVNKGVTTTNTTTTTTPQYMYVLQSSDNNQAVLLNFPTTNGVLPNGQVSVLPTTQQLQLKVTPSKPFPITTAAQKVKHPAPLPMPPVVSVSGVVKPIPPKPHLTIRKTSNGIILQWRMPYDLDLFESIASYQLYAYQETNQLPNTDMWRKVGDVKALALPMACTLTQFADKNTYYFAVRPVDVHKRIGMFSEPEEISL